MLFFFFVYRLPNCSVLRNNKFRAVFYCLETVLCSLWCFRNIDVISWSYWDVSGGFRSPREVVASGNHRRLSMAWHIVTGSGRYIGKKYQEECFFFLCHIPLSLCSKKQCWNLYSWFHLYTWSCGIPPSEHFIAKTSEVVHYQRRLEKLEAPCCHAIWRALHKAPLLISPEWRKL